MRLAIALALILTAVPSGASAGTDEAEVSIVFGAYKGHRLFPDTRPFEGNMSVGQRVTLRYDLLNDGPDEVLIRLKVDADPLQGKDRRTHWNVPIHVTGMARQGGGSCNLRSLTCKATVKEGKSYSVVFFIEAAAPGSFRADARVTTPADDPDPSNNEAGFLTRVLCDINGTDGPDRMTIHKDNVSICGLGGDDRIKATGKRVQVYGGAGDDTFVGVAGRQSLHGQGGHDKVNYIKSPGSMVIALDAKTSSGWGRDNLISIEEAVGSRHNDYLGGSGRNEVLRGRGGHDRLEGRGGKDVLWGGTGPDDFVAREGKRDKIKGGGGYDRAYVDDTDRVHSAVVVSSPPFNGPDPGPYPG